MRWAESAASPRAHQRSCTSELLPPPPANHPPPAPADFPPRWVAKLLKWVFFCVRSIGRATAVVVIAYIIYIQYPLVVSEWGGGVRPGNAGVSPSWQSFLRGAVPRGTHSTHSTHPLPHLQAKLWEAHQGGFTRVLVRAFYEDVLEPEVAVLRQLHVAAAAAVMGAALLLWWLSRGPVPIYLLDFECYRPGGWRTCRASLRCSQMLLPQAGPGAAASAAAHPLLLPALLLAAEECNKVTYDRFFTGSRDSGVSLAGAGRPRALCWHALLVPIPAATAEQQQQRRSSAHASLSACLPPFRCLPSPPQFFDDESLDFQMRILNKSGLSNETFFPPGQWGAAGRRLIPTPPLLPLLQGWGVPLRPPMPTACHIGWGCTLLQACTSTPPSLTCGGLVWRLSW